MTNEKFIHRKTIPTTCKYCGKRVFYHTNDYGSKVFFDELGGKWPIHECNGYLLAKSAKESSSLDVLSRPKKSGIPINGIRTAFKPKVILIKKDFLWELV